jgi:diguanylate cyclase (GGDEF)-like protein
LEEINGTARYVLAGDNRLVRSFEPTPHPLRAAAAAGGVVAPRTTRDVDLAAALAAAGLWDAVAVPLPVVHNLAGTLIVANRLSDPVSFQKGDLQLLEVMANHTSAALQAAQLLDWLRQEVAAKNHLALHDALTDLANRDLFNEQLEASLAQCSETSIVAVMLMDLDRFKQVNDTFGHQSGDELLKRISAQLTRAVGTKGCVGRLGGDEFAVVAVVGSHAELQRIARDVLAAGRADVSVSGRCIEVGASLGVAVAPEHGHDRSTLLGAADLAMYQAKATGGGLAFYVPAPDHRPSAIDSSVS